MAVLSLSHLVSARKDIFSLGILLPLMVSSQEAYATANDDRQLIHQQERQKAMTEQLTPPVPDVRLSPPSSSFGRLIFPQEKPCFDMQQITLIGRDKLPHWLPLQRLADQAKGHCLGSQGINLLMSTLQNRLVDHGYITTRVLAPSQDLKSGQLQLMLMPGKVRHVSLSPDSSRSIQLYSAFPAHEGKLLDLRDIEQGLKIYSVYQRCKPK